MNHIAIVEDEKDFSALLVEYLEQYKKEHGVELQVSVFSGGLKKLDAKQIYFIEIQNRMLHYHTDEGEYIVKGTMQSVEQELSACSFTKCNHWYLVNLMHVKEVKKNLAVVGVFH